MIKAHISEMAVEEVANALTHGVGLILSIFGFVVLLFLAAVYGDGWRLFGSIVYGTCLVVLYAASTCYHTVISPHRKRSLQLLDHCCIYLLIAGTYTPFFVTVFRDTGGRLMMAFMWSFAALGITLKALFRGRLNALGVVFYVLMGWVGVLAIKPMYDVLGLMATVLVAAGGVSYTLGLIFFGWHRIKHHHAIFHLFVLGGSILHYVAIVTYVVPRS